MTPTRRNAITGLRKATPLMEVMLNLSALAALVAGVQQIVDSGNVLLGVVLLVAAAGLASLGIFLRALSLAIVELLEHPPRVDKEADEDREPYENDRGLFR